ncbi:hypothetical protein HPP92_016440 [Vanilla planifolia]|uniref:Uncharacterized protein n=1 Tax=Vanilla planifolia TaxID=51239 RepID=A0A835QJW5_VANPL|nr:hypothetical protein HPP92_016967 [Vanilla planifolia]KAG0471894.1 hypothetical protein HPP92_016440 [Vanilla planifolia]
MREGTANCIDILLAIILPPLGVFLKFGCEVEFWICLVLTLLGYIPGIIYAIYAITKRPSLVFDPLLCSRLLLALALFSSVLWSY